MLRAMGRPASKRIVSRELLERLARPLLVRILAPYGLWCQARHVDLDALARSSDDAAIVPLYKWLAKGDAAMPVDLRQQMLDLAEVATKDGHDEIFRVAAERGLPSPPRGLTPEDLAATMLLDAPAIFRAARVRMECSVAASFTEYEAKTSARIADAACEDKRREAERLIGGDFDARNRTAVCELFVLETPEEILFEITHGEAPKTHGEIDPASMTIKQRTFIATRRDHVIVDKESTARMAIQARYANEKRLYARVIGLVWHGSEAHYGEREILDLGCLNEGVSALEPDGFEGVHAVRVRRVKGKRGRLKIDLGHEDLAQEIAHDEHVRELVATADVRELEVEMEIDGRGEPLRVTLARPNRLVFDRSVAAVERVVRAFFVSKGVLKMPMRDGNVTADDAALSETA
jgi:hypothetical protein